jgi:hypothetical protein
MMAMFVCIQRGAEWYEYTMCDTMREETLLVYYYDCYYYVIDDKQSIHFCLLNKRNDVNDFIFLLIISNH